MKTQGLFTFLALSIFLVSSLSCKSPEIEVRSLGKKFPAPVLTGTSPFEQSVEEQGFVRAQGLCDSRLESIFLSFDNVTWVQPPATPGSDATTLPSGTQNDVDCSDGLFDFHLSEEDLQQYWGIDTGDNGSSVEVLYFKASGSKGESQVLAHYDKNKEDTKPTIVRLQKVNPRGFGGLEKCESFSLQVETEKGHSVTYPEDIEVRLSQEHSGAAKTDVTIYTEWADCDTTVNGQTAVTIPANNRDRAIFLRMPTNAPDVTFDVASTSKLQPMPTSLTVILRDPAQGFRWLQLGLPWGDLLRDICYPVDIRRYTYDHMAANTDSSAVINISSDRPNDVHFYGDELCQSAITNMYFPASSEQKRIYIKYTGTTNVGTLISLVGDISNPLSYDFLPQWVSLDGTGSTEMTRFSLNGPNVMGSGDCAKMSLTGVNKNGSMVPFTSRVVTLTDSGGRFYLDAACTYDGGGPFNVAGGTLEHILYYKAPSYPGVYHLEMVTPDLTFEPFILTVPDPGTGP